MKDNNLYRDKYFLSPTECSTLISSIFLTVQRFSIAQTVHNWKERLNYEVIDGAFISEQLPAITKLLGEIQKTVDDFSEIPVAPLSNSRLAVNINLTPPGEECRWHYDDNAVTAILYLNEVEGGEIDIFEDYRIKLNAQRFSFAQRFLDTILRSRISRWIFSSKHSVIRPATGELLLLKANRCLRSVNQVRGTKGRISIVFAFDTPGKAHRFDEQLDVKSITKGKRALGFTAEILEAAELNKSI